MVRVMYLRTYPPRREAAYLSRLAYLTTIADATMAGMNPAKMPARAGRAPSRVKKEHAMSFPTNITHEIFAERILIKIARAKKDNAGACLSLFQFELVRD